MGLTVTYPAISMFANIGIAIGVTGIIFTLIIVIKEAKLHDD